MGSLREQILNSSDMESEAIALPDWGDGPFYVRAMTGNERDDFESSLSGVGGRVNTKHIRAKLVCKTLCDENGNRIFTDADIAAVGNKSARMLDRVFAVACRLSGIGKDDVEEMSKNSESIPPSENG